MHTGMHPRENIVNDLLMFRSHRRSILSVLSSAMYTDMSIDGCSDEMSSNTIQKVLEGVTIFFRENPTLRDGMPSRAVLAKYDEKRVVLKKPFVCIFHILSS